MPEITRGYNSCKFYLVGQQDLEVPEVQVDLVLRCQGCPVGLGVLVVHLVQGHLKEHALVSEFSSEMLAYSCKMKPAHGT